MRLGEVAKLLGAHLRGDPSIEISGVSSPTNPKPATLVFCQDERDEVRAKRGNPAALVLQKDTDYPNYLRVKDVRYALALFLERMYPENHPEGISDRAVVEEGAKLGKSVYVGPFVYIGKNVVLEDGVKVYPFSYVGEDSYIGEGTVLFSGVCVYPRTVIGKGVRIHSGSVIGADGFGYHVGKEGIRKLTHIGNVIVEDGVEIGANTTIDRALIDSTRIGKMTKIGNLVVIAHNCDVGEANIIVSQVGLSGSVRTGKNVILAGQVGVADHVEIGDNVTVTAKSGVSRNLEAGKTYGSSLPAVEWGRWKRVYAALLRLPELLKKMR